MRAPALDAPALPEQGVPSSLWMVIYDDEMACMPRTPRVFASKRSALAAVLADEAWWRCARHSTASVMEALEKTGTFVFGQTDDEEEVGGLYAISVAPVKVE